MEKDQHLYKMVTLQQDFNPLSRMEKDGCPVVFCGLYVDFNPLSRMEKDNIYPLTCSLFLLFQSTLSHGERRFLFNFLFNRKLFQSTLSHGERHLFFYIIYYKITISIHSLAWRKTAKKILYKSSPKFQSTLSHGERPSKFSYSASFCNFNPLSRMEKDI